MLKEVLKEIGEIIENEAKNVKQIIIDLENDGTISFEISEDDEKSILEIVKNKTEEEVKNAKYMALMECGVGIRMTKVFAEIENMIKEATKIGDMTMLDTINGLFKKIAETQNTKHTIQVSEK